MGLDTESPGQAAMWFLVGVFTFLCFFAFTSDGIGILKVLPSNGLVKAE